MTDDKKDSSGEYPDLTQLIRSIQRIEGKPDCFAKHGVDCDTPDCQWQGYCFKELKKINDKMGLENRIQCIAVKKNRK